MCVTASPSLTAVRRQPRHSLAFKETMMKGAILYGPRDIRFEERETPEILNPTDAVIRLSATCVRIGPLAISRRTTHQGAVPNGPRVLRHRRGCRQRGEVGETRPIRHRLVFRLGQHLPALPSRVPDV